MLTISIYLYISHNKVEAQSEKIVPNSCDGAKQQSGVTQVSEMEECKCTLVYGRVNSYIYVQLKLHA